MPLCMFVSTPYSIESSGIARTVEIQSCDLHNAIIIAAEKAWELHDWQNKWDGRPADGYLANGNMKRHCLDTHLAIACFNVLTTDQGEWNGTYLALKCHHSLVDLGMLDYESLRI